MFIVIGLDVTTRFWIDFGANRLGIPEYYTICLNNSSGVDTPTGFAYHQSTYWDLSTFPFFKSRVSQRLNDPGPKLECVCLSKPQWSVWLDQFSIIFSGGGSRVQISAKMRY